MIRQLDYKSAQALATLGMINSEDLPAVAATALCSGLDSKSLVELAGLSPDQIFQARSIFERSLREVGVEPMSKIDALRCYAKLISAAIIASEIAPLDGAKRIWSAALNASVPSFHELDGFIYAASEMEDRPDDRRFFETAILEEAKQVMQDDSTDAANCRLDR